MPGPWKHQLRLALIVAVVVLAGLVALAWLARGEPEKSPFFYDAR